MLYQSDGGDLQPPRTFREPARNLQNPRQCTHMFCAYLKKRPSQKKYHNLHACSQGLSWATDPLLLTRLFVFRPQARTGVRFAQSPHCRALLDHFPSCFSPAFVLIGCMREWQACEAGAPPARAFTRRQVQLEKCKQRPIGAYIYMKKGHQTFLSMDDCTPRCVQCRRAKQFGGDPSYCRFLGPKNPSTSSGNFASVNFVADGQPDCGVWQVAWATTMPGWTSRF